MIFILFIPDKYFSSRIQQINSTNINKEHNSGDENNTNNNTFERTESGFQNIDLDMSKSKKRNSNCCMEVLNVIRQPIFLLCIFTLAVLFYILTVIQFQGTEYMINALGATNLTQTLMCFAIICLTSPTLGILIGSSIINYQGGYESKNSILICLISSTLSAICTIPAPFTTNIYTFTLCLWLVLFFGGAIVPPLNGIIMSSIPRELVGTANSIVIMISNLFGYLPAPFLYGIIKDMYGQKQESEKNQERYTMRISLWLSGLGVVFLLIATIIRYKKYDEIYMDKNINEAFTGRKDLRTSTHSSQNRTYIIQYMNGIVSGIEDDCEIISNEDIIKMTEDNNKEKHFQGINYDANNVQSGLNLENSTFKLMKDDDDI
jgi:hypothetical protein